MDDFERDFGVGMDDETPGNIIDPDILERLDREAAPDAAQPVEMPFDAAQRPWQPAIVVCIGGTGLDVGIELRRLKQQFLSDNDFSVAAKEQADSVKLVGVDSWSHPDLASF